MLRDNLAGLIEPMIDCAGAHAFGGHPKQEPTGGCSRSTELTIVVLKRSWRHVFRWKTGRRAENGKPPVFEVTTAAHDSRAVATAQHQSHRTIDPQCLKKSPPRRGGIYALTKNVPSPFHAEPKQWKARLVSVQEPPSPPRDQTRESDNSEEGLPCKCYICSPDLSSITWTRSPIPIATVRIIARNAAPNDL